MDTYCFGHFGQVGRLHSLSPFTEFELDIVCLKEIRRNQSSYCKVNVLGDVAFSVSHDFKGI
jgi:hypothetical protein